MKSPSRDAPYDIPIVSAQPAPETVVFDGCDPDEMTPLMASVEVGPMDSAPIYRDVPFAILFYIHLAIMLWLGIDIAPKGYDKIDINYTAIEDEMRKGDDFTDEDIAQMEEFAKEAAKFIQVYPVRILFAFVLPCALLAFFFASLVMLFMIKPCPKTWVYGCLIESFAFVFILMTMSTIASGSFFMLLTTGISMAAILYYIKIAWRMVPFAAVNLKVALEGVGRNFGVYVVAFIFAKLGVLWVLYWLYVVVGTFAYKSAQCRAQHPDETFDIASDNYSDVCDPPGAIVLLFILSLYWTTTITMNMIQITVAGVVATWAYAKEEANHCCSPAVLNSVFRSLTYSFGSVCFGSLFQALVSLFRYIVEQARNQRDQDDCDGCGSFFLCILECIASLLEDLIYCFNQYAYIFAGIYGASYVESGRRVMDLFRARGWTTVITNNLVGYVLSFTTFTVGVCCGFFGILVERLASQHFGDDNEMNSFVFGPIPGTKFWAFGIATVIGIWVCSVMMNVVKGAVNTAIVCWADSPTAFEMNHPALTKEMGEAWTLVYPEISISVGPAVGAMVV